MLSLDLGRLRRQGSISAEGRVSKDDNLWLDSELAWADEVDVSYTATFAGTGEVVVRGDVTGTLDFQCRRCLRDVPTSFEHELTLVFTTEEGAAESGDAYAYPEDTVSLDLGGALREELILAATPYVLCRPDCAGLCAQCGADKNEKPCDCTDDETDPRWDALRALKSE